MLGGGGGGAVRSTSVGDGGGGEVRCGAWGGAGAFWRLRTSGDGVVCRRGTRVGRVGRARAVFAWRAGAAWARRVSLVSVRSARTSRACPRSAVARRSTGLDDVPTSDGRCPRTALSDDGSSDVVAASGRLASWAREDSGSAGSSALSATVVAVPATATTTQRLMTSLALMRSRGPDAGGDADLNDPTSSHAGPTVRRSTFLRRRAPRGRRVRASASPESWRAQELCGSARLFVSTGIGRS